MDWNISWIILGGIAFALVIINLVRLVFRKTKGGNYLVFGSLSFAVLSVFEEVKILTQWLLHGELGLLNESILTINTVLFRAILILITLNFLAIFFISKQLHKAKGTLLC